MGFSFRSLGTDIREPCDSHGCNTIGVISSDRGHDGDAISAISSDSKQDESEVYHLQYNDNNSQHFFYHTYPSFNANHDAQSPSGVPCLPGDADKKAKPPLQHGIRMIQEMSLTSWQKPA